MTKSIPLIISFIAIAAVSLGGCSSGGGSGPSGPTETELNLLYCRAVNVEGEIHIQWAADAPTRGEIRYGRTSYTNFVNVSSRLDTHDVVLAGLEFSSHYIYRLNATDSLSREIEFSGDFTTPAKSTPEPIITGLTISNVTETEARVTWRTDEPATSILYYGTISPTDSLTRDSLVMQHEFVLTDLQPSTTYRIRAEAVDSTNLRGYGRDSLFTTAARMMISFPDTVIGLGDTILLPIYLANAEDLAALRFGIEFSTGRVEVVAVEPGPFYTDREGFIFFNSIRNGEGIFYTDLTWTIEYEGDERVGTQADGDGIIAFAALRGLDNGSVQATFDADSTFGLDIFSNTRVCSLRAGNIVVQP